MGAWKRHLLGSTEMRTWLAHVCKESFSTLCQSSQFRLIPLRIWNTGWMMSLTVIQWYIILMMLV